MNSHKHLSLSQVLAPILQDWNLKVIWIPSCLESIQFKGNYSLAGLIHLQSVRKRSILEALHQEQFSDLWTLCGLEKKKVSISLLQIKIGPRQQRTRCAHIRLPQSKCYNPSGLDIENPSANNMISLEKLPMLNKKGLHFANIIQIAPFVNLWWIWLIMEIQLITKQI